jgi:hypothetical protein
MEGNGDYTHVGTRIKPLSEIFRVVSAQTTDIAILYENL